MRRIKNFRIQSVTDRWVAKIDILEEINDIILRGAALAILKVVLTKI